MRNSTHTGWTINPEDLMIGDQIYNVLNNEWVEIWNLHTSNGHNIDDSKLDKDGDWINNYPEYYSNTDPNHFWSFPLLYPDFPFIISLPMILIVSIISLGILGGVTGAISLKRYQKRLLMKEMGVHDYEMALKMKEGGFTDFGTFKNAQEQNIDTLEEYEFMNELQETKENKEEK